MTLDVVRLDAVRVWLRAVEPSCPIEWTHADEYDPDEHSEHECIRAADHDGMHVCRCGQVTSP